MLLLHRGDCSWFEACPDAVQGSQSRHRASSAKVMQGVGQPASPWPKGQTSCDVQLTAGTCTRAGSSALLTLSVKHSCPKTLQKSATWAWAKTWRHRSTLQRVGQTWSGKVLPEAHRNCSATTEVLKANASYAKPVWLPQRFSQVHTDACCLHRGAVNSNRRALERTSSIHM